MSRTKVNNVPPSVHPSTIHLSVHMSICIGYFPYCYGKRLDKQRFKVHFSSQFEGTLSVTVGKA